MHRSAPSQVTLVYTRCVKESTENTQLGRMSISLLVPTSQKWKEQNGPSPSGACLEGCQYIGQEESTGVQPCGRDG